MRETEAGRETIVKIKTKIIKMTLGGGKGWSPGSESAVVFFP